MQLYAWFLYFIPLFKNKNMNMLKTPNTQFFIRVGLEVDQR